MDWQILEDSEVNDEDLYKFKDTPGNPRRPNRDTPEDRYGVHGGSK